MHNVYTFLHTSGVLRCLIEDNSDCKSYMAGPAELGSVVKSARTLSSRGVSTPAASRNAIRPSSSPDASPSARIFRSTGINRLDVKGIPILARITHLFSLAEK